ncbi:transporter family protein [Mycoplana sp. BE70]|uniref:EamA family transporter n=1 Tax=Mycoplana sp. BE70 TaxID=2817775 RepID=UPI0028594135|nr:EamA family transporter [Mycoplana sp. BE70]MDR6756064.1 transporter family protein [Mycoplana sp. BE70]
MKPILASWQFWAVGSAVFAALTAVFAKIGIEGVNSDFATFVRTIVILAALAFILAINGSWQEPASVSGRSWLFLVLSGLATGASWVCYFHALKLGDASQVAPVDKLSVVLVVAFAALFLGERLSPMHWLAVLMIAVGAVMLTLRI